MDTKRTDRNRKMAGWIVEAAKELAANTVNRSTSFHVYEREIPEEVKKYLEEK